MTAPARTTGPGDRARSAAAPQRERGTTRSPDARERARSAAAQRAYARRAERAERGRQPGRNSQATARTRARPGTRQAGGAMLSSRASFVVLVIALLGAGIVATLWLSTQATAGSYQLERAQQSVSRLAARVERLHAQVAHLRSPEVLARQARGLGMVPAGNPARLVVGPGGKVTVVGSPEEVTRPAQPPPPTPRTHQPPAHQQADRSPQGTMP